jgi:hypothetical protein
MKYRYTSELTKCFTVFIAITLMYGLSSCSSNTNSQKVQNQEEQGDRGSEGILIGTETVDLGHTKDDYEALIKASLANDNYGIKNLIESGRILSITSGQVRARLLDRSWNSLIQIRILSGEYEGQSFWTAKECLRKL